MDERIADARKTLIETYRNSTLYFAGAFLGTPILLLTELDYLGSSSFLFQLLAPLTVGLGGWLMWKAMSWGQLSSASLSKRITADSRLTRRIEKNSKSDDVVILHEHFEYSIYDDKLLGLPKLAFLASSRGIALASTGLSLVLVPELILTLIPSTPLNRTAIDIDLLVGSMLGLLGCLRYAWDYWNGKKALRAWNSPLILEQSRLSEEIRELHEAITEKRPLDGLAFDSWYADKPRVYDSLFRLGREVAKTLRENGGIVWKKGMHEELQRALAEKGVRFENWEDSPDGALAGLAVLLAGWIANQSAGKSKDNPADVSLKFFETCTRQAINEAIRIGEGLSI